MSALHSVRDMLSGRKNGVVAATTVPPVVSRADNCIAIARLDTHRKNPAPLASTSTATTTEPTNVSRYPHGGVQRRSSTPTVVSGKSQSEAQFGSVDSRNDATSPPVFSAVLCETAHCSFSTHACTCSFSAWCTVHSISK